MILGIDPGISGAIALLDGGAVARVWDMPTVPKTSGKGQQVCGHGLTSAVIGAIVISETAQHREHAYVEDIHAMPGQGVTSMFSMGRSLGVVVGVLAALGVPYTMVTPSAWKRRAGLLKAPKDASRRRALELYPAMADQLSRKKDHGRAEAILIAHFGG